MTKDEKVDLLARMTAYAVPFMAGMGFAYGSVRLALGTSGMLVLSFCLERWSWRLFMERIKADVARYRVEPTDDIRILVRTALAGVPKPTGPWNSTVDAFNDGVHFGGDKVIQHACDLNERKKS